MVQSPYPEAMVHNYPCCVFGVQVEGREEVGDLLGMEGKVDLVIPRGGNALVRSVMDQNQGRIPVLGHTEGVCHVYVDQHADIGKATKIGQFPGVGGWLFSTSCSVCRSGWLVLVATVVDAKCDYPAACNAMETLLIHSALLNTPNLQTLINTLKQNQVQLM